MRIFVYGTLRSSHWNNDSYLSDSPCLGRFVTKPIYDLVDGGLPFLLPQGTHAVAGEVYEVGPGTLQDLDWLEGHPDHYRRGPVELQDGPHEVEAYFMPQEKEGAVRAPMGDDGALEWSPWYGGDEG